MAEYDCDVCGGAEFVEVPHIREYTAGQAIHICKGCGLVYCRTRRTPEELALYWEKQIYGRDSAKKDAYDPERPVFSGRYGYGLSFLKKYVDGGIKGKRVFDLGMGEGQFAAQMRDSGAIVEGLESSKDNSKVLDGKKLTHFVGTVEQYDAQPDNKKFAKSDVATILFVLQNSQSATDMIKAVYNQLKEGGQLFIMMGSRIMVPFRKPMGTYFVTLPHDVQPYHFSISTLQHLLAKCGLQVEKVSNYWDDDLLCVLARKMPKGHKIAKMKDDYKEVAQWFERWHAESQYAAKYIRKVPTVDYSSFPSYHTFYGQWK